MAAGNVSEVPGPVLAARALLKELQEKHAVFRECLPLAIGIDKQLLALDPQLDKKALRMALRYHTGSVRYLKGVEKAEARSNLDGTPADALTDEHRAYASEQLRERFRKDAERRKTQRAAEEAARVRAQKLEQLAAKFSRK